MQNIRAYYHANGSSEFPSWTTSFITSSGLFAICAYLEQDITQVSYTEMNIISKHGCWILKWQRYKRGAIQCAFLIQRICNCKLFCVSIQVPQIKQLVSYAKLFGRCFPLIFFLFDVHASLLDLKYQNNRQTYLLMVEDTQTLKKHCVVILMNVSKMVIFTE